MSKRKIHLNGLSLRTLCGIDKCNSPMNPSLSIAKKYKDVTCKACMKTWEYKQYLLGKFKEKPIEKSQTQGYMDIVKDMHNEPKKQPFCWKCNSEVSTLTKAGGFELTGCTENSKIHSYSDAEKMCPLIKELEPPMVILALNGGVASMIRKSDNVCVEIRDYDVEGDWDAEDDMCFTDDEGDRYQKLYFPAKDIDLGSEQVVVKLDPIEEDEPIKYINYYRCDDCNTEWQDEWSCACDDECPVCAVDYSPYKSVDINKEEENKTIIILLHNISYYLDDDSTVEAGDCEYEHIIYMIQQGYIEGELVKADPKDNDKTANGYWKIVK